MARKDTKKTKADTEDDIQPETWLIPDDEHPDYVWGQIEGASDGLDDASAMPGIPHPVPFPGPFPLPDPPQPGPGIPPVYPQPFPIPKLPVPIPKLPIRFCSAVSGTYIDTPAFPRPLPGPIAIPRPLPFKPRPLPLITRKVRVDVDRFFPQMRISIEVNRLIPKAHAHAIARVTSDKCTGWNRRQITAEIIYRDGTAGLIPGTTVVFEAQGSFRGYTSWSLTLSNRRIVRANWPLTFSSRYFDPFEFEVDRVSNADTPTTTYDTASHPNRPATLPAEVLSIANVFQRAGFDAKSSPNTSVIPASGAGANGTWSDAEMHNAMITYWSRFANKPQWAMWVLFANQHDNGYSLGGVMFDDIGPNHRQGTAIFTNSFIQDAPDDDPDPAAWRQRMAFWTAVHEMGHGFNLAHSWQKALSIGGDTGPWTPQTDRPEARSFMNYPFFVEGDESAFFADFAFRFDDEEIQFMRHAPRRFVQMGNANWFVNHAFEAPPPEMAATGWNLAIRPNREVNEYAFLEPVRLELKLTNIANSAQMVDADLLADADNIEIFVGRAGGHTRRHNAFIRRLEMPEMVTVEPGQSLYAAHLVGASTSEWLIDEPGFYKVQVAVMVNGLPVLSNVLRLFVAPPKSDEESRLAPDYFTPEVARALAFDGAPALENAMNVLHEVADRCPKHPAARHAQVATSAQWLRDFKYIDADGKDGMDLRSTPAQVEKAAKTQMDALADAPEEAARTLGHIDYFDDLERLADALANEGDKDGAVKVLKLAVSTMKKRGVIERVVTETSTKLAAIK